MSFPPDHCLRVLSMVAAVHTVRFVHAEERAALPADPLDAFFGNKGLYTDSLDALQVCDGADTVAGLIAPVKAQQDSTGKFGAGKAKLVAAGSTFRAVPDCTGKARVRLVPVASPAARTRPAIPDIRPAQAAIQSARCNEDRVHSLSLDAFGFHGVSLDLISTVLKFRTI
jgi:hypothetical protein